MPEPSEREALIDRLAGLCGIEPGYVDIQGTSQRVSHRTKARLLSALGYSAASDAGASRAGEAAGNSTLRAAIASPRASPA